MRFTFELSLLALVATAAACSKASPPQAMPSASALATGAAPASVLLAAELSSATAFELAARPQGLELVWASAGTKPDWLFEVELGQDGLPRGPARSLRIPARTLGKVVDLSASFVGEQLGLAWLEQGSREARAQATLIDAGTTPTLLDLGASALVPDSARGNIALAAEAERGRALVMWRGLEAPCVDAQAGPCTGFTFRRVRAGAAEPTGLPLTVPAPCASHSVELATSRGRFHYGVCARQAAGAVTTMFSIQYEPEYARAEPLLASCLPLGLVDVQGEPWLIGDCRGKRRAARVPVGDEAVRQEDVDSLSISCTPLRAELRQGRFALTLREPQAGLQPILPASWVPTGARAGWTGTTLVIAYPSSSGLALSRFACRAGKLQSL